MTDRHLYKKDKPRQLGRAERSLFRYSSGEGSKEGIVKIMSMLVILLVMSQSFAATTGVAQNRESVLDVAAIRHVESLASSKGYEEALSSWAKSLWLPSAKVVVDNGLNSRMEVATLQIAVYQDRSVSSDGHRLVAAANILLGFRDEDVRWTVFEETVPFSDGRVEIYRRIELPLPTDTKKSEIDRILRRLSLVL